MTVIAILNAGISQESTTTSLGRAIQSALVELAETRGLDVPHVEWIDVRQLAHPVIDAILTGFPSGELSAALDRLDTADAVVALTPTYQGSYSGLFKSFLDVVPENALRGTPVLLGATGGSTRHSLVTETALRPLAIYLHADPVPTAIFAATEDWGAPAADSSRREGDRLVVRIRRAAGELLDRIATPSQVRGAAARRNPLRAAEPPSSSGEGDPQPADSSTSARDAWPDFLDFQTLRARGGLA